MKIWIALCSLSLFISLPVFAQNMARPRATPIPIAPTVRSEQVEKSQPVPAATPAATSLDEVQAKARAATAKVGAVLNESKYHRDNSNITVMLGYAPIDMILPSKLGGSVGWNDGAEASYEIEYMGSKLSVPFVVKDLGSFSDKRISIIKRSYKSRNSFNFHYGVSYFDTDVAVGNEYLSSATNVPRNLDLIGIKSLGVIWGVGNRWNFKPGFTAGVDWISWAQPLIVLSREDRLINYVNDEGTRDALKQALNLSSYVPRFTLLKVQFGWTF